ncbi:MAG: aspartate kinase [Oscillospiraceae bacterium]|jgi:aspartate kinase|nr:aspartate kinase [Oscillospiraceae bacterium]MCI9392159.1 aspartate kinase [Oscillospiraceae bacterium]
MSLIVQKFGGSSVRDAQRIRNVAHIIADAYRAGNQVLVVLSAQGDTTDDLIEKAREINPRASKREMDMLLSTGEQISIALCAMALEGMGLPVVSLTAWQVGIHTSSTYSDARIKTIDSERVQRELDKNKIVLVAGFQGINRVGDVTTLGRGGSDTSAVALAAAFDADLCQIFTDVDGVYTTDPRVCSNARKLEAITYDEMLELASQGAQVLHNRSVELAKKYHVNMEVVSSLERKPGTKVKEVVKMEKTNIAGVAKDVSIARIAVVGLEHSPGVAFRIFSLLGKANINVDAIIQSIGRDESKDISFTLPRADVEDALRVLEEQKEALRFDHVTVEDKIAKVSIVGAGMMTTPGVAAKMFEALYDANINIQMINTSEIRVSVLIDENDAAAAVRAVHDKFFGEV